jgi:hypothetical protein
MMPTSITNLKARMREISCEDIRQRREYYALPEEIREKAFDVVAARNGSRRVRLAEVIQAAIELEKEA